MTPHDAPDWFTVEQAAEKCHRKPGTIRNLISKHQLPRRLLWRVYKRKRKRATFVSYETILMLRKLTLERED